MNYMIIERQAFDDMKERFKQAALRIEMLTGNCTGNMQLRKWLGGQDVCRILSVSKRTLQTYRDNGSLPYTQIEHKIYYKPEDIRLLMDKSKKQ